MSRFCPNGGFRFAIRTCETFPRLVCVEDRMQVCHVNAVEVAHTPCGPPDCVPELYATVCVVLRLYTGKVICRDLCNCFIYNKSIFV